MSFKKKRVLCLCATSLGTSGYFAEAVKTIAKELKADVETIKMQTSGRVIENYVERMGYPDFVVGSPYASIRKRFPPEVPVVDGIPFLTGIGKEKAIKEVKEQLQK